MAKWKGNTIKKLIIKWQIDGGKLKIKEENYI